MTEGEERTKYLERKEQVVAKRCMEDATRPQTIEEAHLPAGPPVAQCRSVKIIKVANGFNLHIGCEIFIAKTWVEASTGLAEYWENPAKAEKKYTTW